MVDVENHSPNLPAATPGKSISTTFSITADKDQCFDCTRLPYDLCRPDEAPLEVKVRAIIATLE